MECFLTTNIKLYLEGDQAYTCNLQHEFPGLYFILHFTLCICIYNLTYITCITHKLIVYFVTCEI